MKIGILSLKYINNYGGILQSLALQEVLLKMGHEVEIINYERKHKEGFLKLILYRITDLLFNGKFLTAINDRRKERGNPKGCDSASLVVNNESFMNKYLKRSKIVCEDDIEIYANKFDCIIVGSDQIWSVTSQSKLIYFFDWEYKGKKIAYAACSVNKNPSFLNKIKIKRLLKKFDYISVRDELTYNFVYKTSNIIPNNVVDPTLLYNFSLLPNERIINEPYIFVYILGNEIDGGNLTAINFIKKYLGQHLKVVSVVIPSVSIAGKIGADYVFDDADPLKWINLIRNSEFIYTDSFHGVVFSLKYKKRFIAYYNFAKRATRLIDLKKKYQISNIIDKVEKIDDVFLKYNLPNYDSIERNIKESQKYLESII